MDFAHRFSLVQLVSQYLQVISLMHAISVIITPTFYVKFLKIVKLLKGSQISEAIECERHFGLLPKY